MLRNFKVVSNTVAAGFSLRRAQAEACGYIGQLTEVRTDQNYFAPAKTFSSPQKIAGHINPDVV